VGHRRLTVRRVLFTIGRTIETAVIACAFTALVLGVTLGVVAAPGVTSFLIRAERTWVYTGMSPAATVTLADKTRQWVTGDLYGDAATKRPAELAAFAPDELSHLDDVRKVMSGARTATGAAAAILALWLVASLIMRRWAAIRRGVLWGGIVPIVLVAGLAAASFTDFEAVFARSPSLFFAAGTWQFPPDSLLIRVFPGEFWMAAGALWGGLTALAGVALVIGSRTLPRDEVQAEIVSRSYAERRAAREERARAAQR
jgi:Protein of unknown function (DUF1461)